MMEVDTLEIMEEHIQLSWGFTCTSIYWVNLVGRCTHTPFFFRAIQQMWRNIFHPSLGQKKHTRHLHCTVRNMCTGYKVVPHS